MGSSSSGAVSASLAVAETERDDDKASVRPGTRTAWLRRLVSNPVTATSLIVIGIAVIMALFAPLIATQSPTLADPFVRLQGPSVDHLLGTDDLGRDVFSRLIYGARVSLIIGLGVTLASGVLGSLLGLVAGYVDRLDPYIMRTMDGLMAFPSILLAIAIMASLGPSMFNVFVALTVVYTPTIARLVRSTTLVTREQPYVESARVVGMGDARIMGKYIFPNGLSPLIVQCTFVIAFAIISEASLSFLGAGVPPQQPTWGNMLRDGQSLMQQAWWMAVFPGTILFVMVLAMNLVGDGLRDVLDPRSQRR